MRQKYTLIPLLLSCLFTIGCGNTAQLISLDHDIPESLVNQYNNSHKAYVDEGFTWIPFIFTSMIKVSKISDGFQADEFGSLGPFFSLFITKQDARFNKEGKLLENDTAIGLGPFGLLLCGGSSTRFDHQGQLLEEGNKTATLWGFFTRSTQKRVKIDDHWKSENSFKILWGLIGNERRLDGENVFYFLYIPISDRLIPWVD